MTDHNKDTILEGKKVVLTEEQSVWCEDFHTSRLAFVFKDGKLLLNLYDKRETSCVSPDFGIDDEEFETLIRGYIKPGKIVFYMSSHYSEIPDLPQNVIDQVLLLAVEHFGFDEYQIQNGLIIGEPGTEFEPIKIIGNIKLY